MSDIGDIGKVFGSVLNDFQKDLKEKDHKIKVLERALENVCEDISLYEDITSADYKKECYIKEAKKELKNEKISK